MAMVLRFDTVREADTALKAIKKAKKAKGARALKTALRAAGKPNGKSAKAVRSQARMARTANATPAESAVLHPDDVRRVKKLTRRAVRAALRESTTPEPATPAAAPAAELLTGEALWANRGRALMAAAATSGPAAAYWRNYEAGNPLSQPLSNFSSGPHPYGGDGAAAA